MEAHCQRKGLTITARYQEVSRGWSKNRPEFQRMLADARRGRFDTIVCWKSDRLSRGMYPAAALMEVIEAYQIELEAVMDAIAMKTFGLMAAIGKIELDNFRERASMGKRGSAKQGRIPVNNVPYGYRLGEDRRPQAVEAEVAVIRRVFHMYVRERMGAPAITKQLTAEGVPTPKAVGRWYDRTVHRILGNETYLGTWWYGKVRHVSTEDGMRVYERPEDEWFGVPFPPVVDQETWEQAQEAKKRRLTRSGRNTRIFYLLQHKEMLREQVRQAMANLESKERQKRINLTDGDARLMKTRGSILLSYNAQAMVSPLEPDGGATGMFITAVDMADDSRDETQLVPMLEQAEETTGTKSEMTLADAAYHSGKGLEECARRGQSVAIPETRQQLLGDPYHKDRFTYDEHSDSFRCPQGQRRAFLRIQHTNGVPFRLYRASGAVCQACPAFGVCTRAKETGRSLVIGPYDAAPRRHRAWMSTNEARDAYKRRKPLVEPFFGIIKEQLAARRFLLRGMVNVSAEWTLLATAFNLRTLWRVWRLCVFVNLLRGPKPHFAS